MGNQPASTRFRARFESALHAYQETTGVILVEHPLAMQLKNSHSVDSFTTLLRHEARAFSDLQGSDTIMKLIESTVSILYTLSATASFGEANGLVRQNVPMGCSTSLMNFCSHSHRQRQYLLASLSYLPYVPFSSSYARISYIQVDQAAKHINSSYDTLVDLLESIDHLLKRVDIYTRIPPTPAMDEIVFKIMVELLSTLALATKELKQERPSESILADILPC